MYWHAPMAHTHMYAYHTLQTHICTHAHLYMQVHLWQHVKATATMWNCEDTIGQVQASHTCFVHCTSQEVRALGNGLPGLDHMPDAQTVLLPDANSLLGA